MATATGIVNLDGKEFLVQSLNTSTSLNLAITYTEGGAPLITSNSVTYNPPVQGSTSVSSDISENSTFTLGNDGVVTQVALRDGTTVLISTEVTSENFFPAGGDFIITNYTVTVS